jgi:hypothetical protein
MHIGFRVTMNTERAPTTPSSHIIGATVQSTTATTPGTLRT